MFFSFCCSLAAFCSVSFMANWTNNGHMALDCCNNIIVFYLDEQFSDIPTCTRIFLFWDSNVWICSLNALFSASSFSFCSLARCSLIRSVTRRNHSHPLVIIIILISLFADDLVARFQMDPNVIMSNQPEYHWTRVCEYILLHLARWNIWCGIIFRMKSVLLSSVKREGNGRLFWHKWVWGLVSVSSWVRVDCYSVTLWSCWKLWYFHWL